jgi:hypothetical protein
VKRISFSFVIVNGVTMWDGVCPATQGFNQDNRPVSRFFYVWRAHNDLDYQNHRASQECANETARRVRGWALNFVLLGRRERETAVVDRQRYRKRDVGSLPRHGVTAQQAERYGRTCYDRPAVTLLWENSRGLAREFPTTN